MLDNQISDNSVEINEDRNSTKVHIKVHNSYVSTKRCVASVRTEIVTSAKKFLSDRLADDHISIILQLKTFLNVRNSQDTIKSIRRVIESLSEMEM